MEAGEEVKNTCDLSEIMEKFGKYQYIQYTLVCLPTIFMSMISINYVFVVGEVDYRCRINECEDSNSTAKFPSWWPDKSIDKCSTPVLKSDEIVCNNSSFSGNLAECTDWIYESNNTVVGEFNLACQPWKSNLIGVIHNMGMLLSMVISGWMSDKFGRKPTLIFCVVGGAIGSLKTLFSSYYIFVIIEFLEGFVTGGSITSSMVILLEISGTKHRLLSGVIFAYAIYIGECLLALIAMYIPYWRSLIHIMCAPCIFFIFLISCLTESPRWQIVSGKIDEAKKILTKIADTNKIHVNNEELENADEVKLKEKFKIGSNEVTESMINAFKSKEIMIRLLVSGICRFTSCFIYYGMAINSVWLPGNKHINFLLSTVMSFPGEIICLYLMNRIGRKAPLKAGYLTYGVLCIILIFTPARYVWLRLAIFMVAKVIISACYTGAITYAMELFPTNVRGSLLGLTSICAKIGGMLAPLSPILNAVSEFVPILLFGVCAVVTGLLLILTPETKDMPLFDTIDQVELECSSKGRAPDVVHIAEQRKSPYVYIIHK